MEAIYIRHLPMAPMPRNSVRVRVIAVSAFMIALVVSLSANTRSSSATSAVDRWGATLAQHQHALRASTRSRTTAAASLASLRRSNARLLTVVQQRVVSIYKAGGTQSVADIVVHSTSMGGARDVADVVDTVARVDTQALGRYERVAARINTLETRITVLDSRIRRLKRQVVSDRAHVVAAMRAARRAREAMQLRQQQMARVADLPLVPRAVAPETIVSQAATASQSQHASSPPSSTGFTQTGVASMYSDQLAGEQTSTGEQYDPNAMTAAHLSLPLGSWVSVRGPAGSVLVRINDRGPYVAGRIIDLSRAAAQAIGLPGLGTVTITVL